MSWFKLKRHTPAECAAPKEPPKRPDALVFSIEDEHGRYRVYDRDGEFPLVLKAGDEEGEPIWHQVVSETYLADSLGMPCANPEWCRVISYCLRAKAGGGA